MAKKALIGGILLMMVCVFSGCAKKDVKGEIGTAISSDCMEEWSSHMLPADANAFEKGKCLQEFCTTKDSQSFVRGWTRPATGSKNNAGYRYELIFVRGQWCPGRMTIDGEMFFLKTDLIHGESTEEAKIRLVREAEMSIIDFRRDSKEKIWWANAMTNSLSLVVGITEK